MTTLPSSFDDDERTLLEKVEKFQAGFIGCATQDGGNIDGPMYARLRLELLSHATARRRLADFVRKCPIKASSGSSSRTSFRPTGTAANISARNFARSLFTWNFRRAHQASNRLTSL
jgi:hypothetical protein